MLQVSRDHNLKIPKQIKLTEVINSKDDIFGTKVALKEASDEKLDEEKIKAEIKDMELEAVAKIPFNSNDLIVITVVKKLGAYVIAITEKSPKKFRGVFVNRMQNYCLEILENLLKANFIRVTDLQEKLKREQYQKEAIIKLKLLGYISMVAQNSSCILMRQYKQISLQITEAMNLIVAWKKSDDTRWKKKDFKSKDF